MVEYKGRFVNDAVVNFRGPNGIAPLVLDGVPFPYYIDKEFGVQVEARDDNVHLVKIAIQVDRNVTINDLTTLGDLHYEVQSVTNPSESLCNAALREQQAQQDLVKARNEAAAALIELNKELGNG